MTLRKITTLFFVLSIFISNAVAQNLVNAQLAFEAAETIFSKPFIDIDEWRDVPVRHHYIHGGFEGTDTRFSFYFPEKNNYEGHFFQYVTPVPDSENLSQGQEGEADKIGFCVTHGAYFIETNGGGATYTYGSSVDPLIGAYKANAACAQFSKVVAEKLYGKHRTYGYIFGGSGGAYRTIGAIENNVGVWDGAVPYVIGSPMAIPNMFTIRMHAMRILRDDFPQILDAVEPGGSGDMYAGLNKEQKEALEEATKMGFYPPSWYAHATMGIHAFGVLYPGVAMADPTYFTDFWNVPGYFGHDHPESFKNDRIQHEAKIAQTLTLAEAQKMDLPVAAMPGQARGTADQAWQNMEQKEQEIPVALQLETKMPEVQFLGGDLIIKTGDAAGQSIPLRTITDDVVVFGAASEDILSKLTVGDVVQVDNSNFLAAQTYHRHQVPKEGYPTWDQFRDADGNPIYPQRPMVLGPMFAMGASGVIPNGSIKGKVIALENLWDTEALPWQGDWYRQQVQKSLGEKTDDNFRLWYSDHANHADFPFPGDPKYIVSYLGVLQQALLDLSNWVEKGIEPAVTSNYKVVDGQVIVPETADERGGIQPVADVTINGSKRADISAGESVTLKAIVEIPKGQGNLVYAAWDFDGSGEYKDVVDLEDVKVSDDGSHVEFLQKQTFTKPGTHFPVLRVAAQRKGDAETPFARIYNLDRVRVVVE
nr:hypothetical protein [uncultured Draconibacterium sp.]